VIEVGYWPILLQKSFWGEEQKFLEPLMRFTRGDVRDHIVSFEIVTCHRTFIQQQLESRGFCGETELWTTQNWSFTTLVAVAGW
jgi:hypothetical protein